MTDRANRMKFLVLGPLDVVGNGEAVLGGPKQRAVLGMLITRVGNVISNDSLIDGIWGESPPGAVQSSLHSYVSNLRTAVGADIERSGGGYVLNADPASVDAVEFQRFVDEGTKAMSANPEAASDALRIGLGLWRGKPYADLIGVEGLQSEIRRLEELRISAVEARIDADLALGRHQILAGELAALATEYPLRERFQSQLMVALYRDGRQSEALRAYQRTRDYLREELGVDPSTELQELELRILNHDADLLTIRDTVTEHVAFFFTDIAGSTELWETRALAMRSALARHDEILTTAIDNSGGRLFKHTGDGVLAAFPTVVAATSAAVDAQRELEAADWGDLDLQVRMAVDVGEVDVRGGDYFGPPMNRGSRVMSAAHGGQILLSEPAQQALSAEPGVQVRGLGEHRLKGLGAPVSIFQLVADGLPDDFPDLRVDASTAGPARQFGDAIRGYEVRERLAAGRISVVYRAFQPTVGREVAVKVIRPEYANHPSFVRRFESEARTVAGLEHPHIVSLYDYWRDADGAYLVMPLMAGGSLADKNLGALPLDRVVSLVAQVGSALGYAHRQGVIHRDIKPSNILLDVDGNAYISDFGIAVRGVERDAGIQSDSAIYRAPEDSAGAAVDERSDVYSLARVVAGLLTGSANGSPDLTTLDDPLRRLLESAFAEDPASRPEGVDSFVGRLNALNGGMTAAAEPIVSRNPYKGLQPFEVADAHDFFGRDNEIRRLTELVGEHRIVTVVGPSGSGKSSLVRAGLIPALAKGALSGSDQWVTVTTVPGSHPFDELASVLGEVAIESMGDMAAELSSDDHGLVRLSKRLMRGLEGELVIVVDQFEELYTVVASDEVRRSFIRNLIEAAADARSRVRIVLTLRADFYDHPLGDEVLGPIVSDANLALAVPKPGELREAIEKPALNAGVVFEEGLTDQLLADVQEQPGSLPLMQYALASLVAQSLDGRVSIADYERLGGVSGALTQRADEVYRSLAEEEQAVAEEIFMRLVSVSEDADDVRRRVRQSELESLDLEPGYLAEVLRKFGGARLLTFDRDPVTRGPTVEVAHEALLRNWVRFRDWLDARREALILHRRFRAAVSEWEESGRDATYLLTGGRLSQFEAWAAGSDVVLTPDETEFLAGSVAARDAAIARKRRIRRVVLAGFGVAALLGLVLAVTALVQRNEAQESAEVAQARELTLEAEKVLELDPELSAHLALNALATLRATGENSAQAESVLRSAISEDRIKLRVPGGVFAAVHPDSSLFVTADAEDPTAVVVRNVATGDVVERYARLDIADSENPDCPVFCGPEAAAFSPNGNLLAVAYATDPAATIWDRTSGEPFHISVPAAFAEAVVFSRDGQLLAIEWQTLSDSGIEVWSVADRRVVYEVGPGAAGADFNDDGLMSFTFISGPAESRELSVRIVDPVSGELFHDFPVGLDPGDQRHSTQWSPDAGRIAAGDTATVFVLDATTGEVIAQAEDIGRVSRPEWLDNQRYVVGGELPPRVVDASTGELLLELAGMAGGSTHYDVVPGTELIAVGSDFGGESVIFDVSEIGGTEVGGWMAPFTDPGAVYTGDGSRAFIVPSFEGPYLTARAVDGADRRNGDGNVRHVNDAATYMVGYEADQTEVVQAIETGEIIYRAPDGWVVRGINPDGTRVVINNADCSIRLVDPADDSFSVNLAEDVGTQCFFEVSFSPNGDMGHIFGWVFDTRTGEKLFDVFDDIGEAGIEYAGWSAAFSADGSELIVVTLTGPVVVLDLPALLAGVPADEAEVRRIAAHDAYGIKVAESPDGLMIASSSWNEPVKLWDRATGKPLAEFGGNPGNNLVHWHDFHPTLPRLMVSSPNGEIRIHTLDIDELIAIAKAGLSREMTDEECELYFREPCPAP